MAGRRGLSPGASRSLLAVPLPSSGWRAWLPRLPAWLGLFAVVLLVSAVLGRSGPGPEVAALHGPWHGEIVDGSEARPVEVQLPGLLRNQGLPPGARVRVERTVRGTGEPMALWLESPRYAVAVTWDGRVVGASGDPAADGRDARSARSLLVSLPAAPPGTWHQLGLDLRGDYGKGGVTGSILLGPLQEVHRAGRTAEVQYLAVALGLALVALLPLSVAARGPWRPAYAAFGAFATLTAALAFTQSSVAAEVVPDALWLVRLRALLLPLLGGCLAAYGATMTRGRTGPVEWALLQVGAMVAVADLAIPIAWMHGAELLTIVLIAAGLVAFGWHAVQGVRHHDPGSRLLALSLVPLVLGLGSEVLLSLGVRAGSSQLYLWSLLFTTGLAAALMLRDAEVSEQHDRLIRGTLDAMLAVEPGGEVRDANPAAVRMLGPGARGNLIALAAPGERPRVRAHIERGRTRSDRVEFRTVRDRWVESLATAVDRDQVVLTVRDVTARRDVDRGMLQAARLETMALLLGGIAHDFNNMLGTLLAHLGLLELELKDHPGLRERLIRMTETIERASQLTRRLLTVARGTGSELGACDASDVARAAAELVRPTLPAEVTLEVDLPDDLPAVHGDASDLEQVLVNLLVNARDAVDGEGRVRLVVRHFSLEDGARGVVVAVEDDGPGVPLVERESIFQPFVTTKTRGTGLGLAVAKQILRDHLGRIWLEERPGGGARFLLALRLADEIDLAPAPLPAGRSVLLVEDEAVLLEEVSHALTEAGYEVHPWRTAEDALLWLEDHAPDILVTDIGLPGASGLDLAEAFAEHHPDTPVLLVSAYVPDDVPPSWHRLHKPVRAAKVVSTVGRLRRRAERDDDEQEITSVSYLFPSLGRLTAAAVGLEEAP